MVPTTRARFRLLPTSAGKHTRQYQYVRVEVRVVDLDASSRSAAAALATIGHEFSRVTAQRPERGKPHVAGSARAVLAGPEFLVVTASSFAAFSAISL
jgi:hypothetical protein